MRDWPFAVMWIGIIFSFAGCEAVREYAKHTAPKCTVERTQ